MAMGDAVACDHALLPALPVPPVCASSPSCPSIHPPRSLRQSVRTIPEGWGQGSTHGWFPLDESKKAPTFDVNDTLQPFPGVSWFRPGTPCLPCSALSCRVVSLSSALFMAKGGLFHARSCSLLRKRTSSVGMGTLSCCSSGIKTRPCRANDQHRASQVTISFAQRHPAFAQVCMNKTCTPRPTTFVLTWVRVPSRTVFPGECNRATREAAQISGSRCLPHTHAPPFPHSSSPGKKGPAQHLKRTRVVFVFRGRSSVCDPSLAYLRGSMSPSAPLRRLQPVWSTRLAMLWEAAPAQVRSPGVVFLLLSYA